MKDFQPISKMISSANEDILIITHRGDWSQAPENSIQAMLMAAKSGADMVEIDVQRAKNGQIYLMHDDTTNRTTNRKGATTSVTHDELKNIFLREGAGGENAPITSTQVPTLRAALEAARGKVHLNIDTKHRCDLEAVGNLVYEMDMQDHVLIKMVVDPVNPDLSILQARWFQRLAFMPVMLTPRPGKMAEDAVKLIQLFDAQIIEVSFLSVEELAQTSEKMKQLGVRIWCNTLDAVHPLNFADARALKNPEDVWGRLIRGGIGAIQTDQTAALSDFIGRN